MSCRARCSPAPGQVNAQATECINLIGDGSIPSPLEAEPIIDPRVTNILQCGPAGLLAEAGTVSAQGALLNFGIGPAPPGPPGPRITAAGPTNVSITNPTADEMDVIMLCTLHSTFFSEGSCQPDMKLRVDIDGGGFVDACQLIAGNLGAIGFDPALGGDGTANPFGVNRFHISTGDFLVGYNPDSVTPTLGAPLAAGATKSVDFDLDFGYVGAWNATDVILTLGLVTLIGVTRA